MWNFNPKVTQLDRCLFEAVNLVELNPSLVPANVVSEEKRFMRAWNRGQVYQPRLRYPAFRVRMKDIHLPIRKVSFPNLAIKTFYEQKQEELILKWRLIKAQGKKPFSEISKQLYGLPTKRTVQRAIGIIKQKTREPFDEPVEPLWICQHLRRYLSKKKLAWRVKTSPALSSKVAVRSVDQTLLVHHRIPFGKSELGRLKIHEIQTHLFRGENGRAQPFKIFQAGLAGYTLTEEGLAVFLEARTHKLDPWQKRTYAARNLAVHLAQRHSFYEVFKALVPFIPEPLAFRIVVRSKRGLIHTQLAGGLTKDHQYLSGLEKMTQRKIRNRSLWEACFAGKVGISDLATVSRLIKQGLLHRPRFLPDIVLRWMNQKS